MFKKSIFIAVAISFSVIGLAMAIAYEAGEGDLRELYPGKLTQVETFRVGCIGAIGPDEMRHAVHAIRDAIAEMGIRRVTPAVSTRAAA